LNTGLATGSYNVTITSNNGCSSTIVGPIFVPVDDPIGLTALCATAFTGGTIDIPITVSDFDNINSTEFTVTVSGGLTITSAVPNNLPQTTGVNMVGTNQVTFSWFVQDMNTTPSVSLADGTTILTITAQAPNTAGSYDVTISGSNTQPEPSATQNQGAGAAASTSITVNTTDCSGTIQTSPASISGNIKFFSPTGNGVNDVVLNLDTDGDKSTVMSSSIGEYSVLANPNSNVTLSPSRPHTSQAQLLHGVNGGDLVQIQRRILGLSNTVTGDPYRTIAADANGNNRVDGGDLVRIQRAILGLETSFVVPSWRFARSSQTFSNPDAPFNGLQETYTNNNLNSAVTVDFIGIKVGDADASASHPYRTTTEQGSDKAVLDAVDYRGSLPIRVADQQLKTGGIYEVAFTAQDFRDLLTYQTTIEFDTDVLAFEGIATSGKLVNLDADNFGLHRVKAGMITTVWYNAIAQSLVDGATIFTLRFRAKKGQRLSRVLEFTSNGISQMAMGSDYEPLQVDLTFGEATSLLPNFELRQNKPNPFDDETIISFELEESSFTTLIIMDINGRIIRTYQDNLTKGYHEIAVNRIDIPNAGVYFYQVMTATQKSATRKMVVLD
ncbi:MAG: T9SS type A sorting domain-containing protein, partial [Bacteroidota bacterium]